MSGSVCTKVHNKKVTGSRLLIWYSMDDVLLESQDHIKMVAMKQILFKFYNTKMHQINLCNLAASNIGVWI